jgi:hypothetical protein
MDVAEITTNYESFYAKLFILVVVILFLWVLYKRKHSKKKSSKSDTSNRKTSLAGELLTRYVDTYTQNTVANAKTYATDTIDSYIPSGLGIAALSSTSTTKKHGKKVNKTEEECRAIIQKIYNEEFQSLRPDFLKNPYTNKNLELDCYNARMNLALEYNGQQHYRYTPYFHGDKKNFYSQVHRDDWKRKKCRENGVTLVEVPYWVKSERLEEYIRHELKKKGKL